MTCGALPRMGTNFHEWWMMELLDRINRIYRIFAWDLYLSGVCQYAE